MLIVFYIVIELNNSLNISIFQINLLSINEPTHVMLLSKLIGMLLILK